MYLTTDQKMALENLQNYVLSNSHNCFILKGYAGTGKTTLLAFFIEHLKERGLSFRLLAPTGKAAHVLKSKTKYPAQTIHKEIYDFERIEIFENKEDSENGVNLSFYFKLKEKKEDERVDVYIIDESSLISDQDQGNSFLRFGSGKLLSDFLSYTKGSKIVFCGDHAQLPPVSMNYSPALDEEYLKKNFGLRVTGSELKEIVRTNSENYVYKLSLNIRNKIEEKIFNELFIAENRKLSSEFLINVLTQLYEMREGKIDDTIIIAHSNEQVQEYNFTVKKILSNIKGASDYEIVPGDRLIVYKNYYHNDLTLLNGQSVEVVEVLNKEVVQTSEKEEVTYLDCQLKYYDYDLESERLFKAKILNDFVYSPEPELDRKLYNKVFRTVLVKNSEFREVFNELTKILREMKNSAGEQLRILKTKYLALKLQVSRILRDDEYFNPLLVKFGYAITCHKAQGSEWDNVVIDMKTSNLDPKNEQYFRWLYTAVTRSKREVYFINSFDMDPFKRMKISEVKIQKIKLNGNHGYPANLASDKSRIIVNSLEGYGFKILGVHDFQYMKRFLFEYNSKKMQIDLYYNKKGFYTSMQPYAEDQEAKEKLIDWIEDFFSHKCFN